MPRNRDQNLKKGKFLSFPADFVWGAATSSYQVEGASDEDGREPSIWDTFCAEPGRIANQDSGSKASGHYHRWAEDVEIMAEMGLNAYRFSVSWPRVLPSSSGRINQPGLDFYDRLVDALLSRGIQPFVTLYHWDLPQKLQDRGGWANRDIVDYFSEFACIVGERLGDRVGYWITQNEPVVTAGLGHLTGEHAPGQQDLTAAISAIHHLLLSHGKALQVLRETSKIDPQIGITLNLYPVHPSSGDPDDVRAAKTIENLINRVSIEPLFRGHYPLDLLTGDMQALFSFFDHIIQPGDMEYIASPMDFLGINYYSRTVVKYDAQSSFFQTTEVRPAGSEYSQMWEIYPTGIFELLKGIWQEYQPKQIFITENGVPVADGPDLDGAVRDYRRIRYLRDHLVYLHKALEEGIPVKGYFVWSLLDNFEWAHGYNMRFGLVYIDYATLSRTIKFSGRWYAQVIRQNGLFLKEGLPYFPS